MKFLHSFINTIKFYEQFVSMRTKLTNNTNRKTFERLKEYDKK